jgi:uncharacterized protein (DUF433 family)
LNYGNKQLDTFHYHDPSDSATGANGIVTEPRLRGERRLLGRRAEAGLCPRRSAQSLLTQYPDGVFIFMELIESDPGVVMRKPVIAGTRITVQNVLERIAAGESVEDIVAEHPRLTRAAVLAAVDFGARALRADVIYPHPSRAA